MSTVQVIVLSNPYPPPPSPLPPTTITHHDNFSWYWLTIPLVFLIVLIFLIYISNVDYPDFKIESVSVIVENDHVYSFNNSQSLVTTKWDLGFSVRNPNPDFDFNYREFDVLVQCMSRDWLGTNVAHFSQGAKNTTFGRASVNVLLRRYDPPPLVRGSVWDFAVMFRASYKYKVEAICKNMKVVFSRNETNKGMLVGGPISCPLEMMYDIDE